VAAAGYTSSSMRTMERGKGFDGSNGVDSGRVVDRERAGVVDDDRGILV